jgi:TRAP-type C4-dicarboxylate transport system permease small subunit
VSHGFDAATAGPEAGAADEPRLPGVLGALDRAMRLLNRVILALGGLCLVAACLVLTHSVVVRYLLKQPTEWQDEMAVFLIVGATFLSAAGVQAKRGHVAIEAVTGLLSPAVNRARLLLADVISLTGQISQSTWGPPLWIPYTLMSAGMSLLCLQFALQIAEGLVYGPRAAGWAKPKIGLGADLNTDLRGAPEITPRGPDPLGQTMTAKGKR